MQPPKIINTEPSLKDLLDAHKKDIFFTMNCHAIATIESFDSSNQTCVAKINYDKMFYELKNGKYVPRAIPYPILTDIPVVFLTGGKSGLTFPIAKGDQALIMFNDRDSSNWFEGANSGFAASPRMHSLSDGVAIVGLHRKSNLISGFDVANPHLWNEKAGIRFKPNKLEIYNETDKLGALLQELIDEVKSLVTQTAAITVQSTTPGTPTSTPNNAGAISAIAGDLTATATKIQGLLE